MSTYDDRVDRVAYGGPVRLEPDPPQAHLDAVLYSRQNPNAWVESSLVVDTGEYR